MDRKCLALLARAWVAQNASGLVAGCDDSGVEGGLLVPGWRESLLSALSEPPESPAAEFNELYTPFLLDADSPGFDLKAQQVTAAGELTCAHLADAFARTLSNTGPGVRHLATLVDPAARGDQADPAPNMVMPSRATAPADPREMSVAEWSAGLELKRS